MDVTGLSISVEVDLSGFEEAMLQIMAVLVTTGQEMQQLSQTISTSFNGIQSGGKESESSLMKVLEASVNIFDVFSDTKKLLGTFKEIGSLGEALELGATTDGLGLVAAGIMGIIKLVVDWNKAATNIKDITHSTGEDTQQWGNSLQQGGNTFGGLRPGPGAVQDNSRVVMPLRDTNVPMWMQQHNDTVSTSSKAAEAESSAKAATVATKFNDDFVKLLEHNYEKLKEIFPNPKDLITVKASITQTQTGVPNTPATLPDNRDMSKIDVQDNSQLKDIKALDDAIVKETADQKKAAEAAKEHAEAMEDLAHVGAKAISTLAEGLGEMAAGKKVNMGAMMLKMLGDAIKNYGEKLLGLGATMLGFGDPMGGLKLAEGGALIAAGSAMTAIKMAQGGLVSGSTFANVGEYAGANHNPEVVAPLDKLRSMMGGNNINVTHRIQGSDLLIVLNNELQNQGFGSNGGGLQLFGQ